ncbi:uncharacterized protein NFIA_099680 [Aspergillus fischeri NRRL 181]|uniref:Secreted protein CSS2 C-terminal domain-containing protein n=1 Tax=Neosartorya fischeri (strain ATCC 1020 / DSM 3700 / CBS 544.65 / FGSC A1164 / JCM 1740 / NRRL 181 / WB 181) TaxID=331117 RepID=A1DBU2_NEOFI|nr:uncharacterized protein NFIA_099680 [Aspergillus fischeri NRRL 181]EAW20332.1 hypothetical protein NFIA_099680 [Aspergillus fischeri NRRL 181]
MVRPGKVLCGVLAFSLVDRGCAEYSETTTVLTTPIIEEWNNGESNITISFDVMSAEYASQYTNSTDEALAKRTGITIKSIRTTIVNGAEIITTAKAALDIWQFIAGIIKNKSDLDSCTLTYGTDTADDYYYGYAYEATTTGTNCNTTAEKKTILAAVEKCANQLHAAGAVRGCCVFSHGGTWRGHLRLTAEPNTYPAHSVTC